MTDTPDRPDYDGPPPWTKVGRHGMFPEADHDEIARFNFLAGLNRHMAGAVAPGVAMAYEKRVRPAFEKEHGRPPETRHEVRRAMARDTYYQTWSSLRRSTMEMRQENGRTVVLRQRHALADKAAELNAGKPTLTLNPDLKIPPYLTAVDHHCMPGSYYTELFDGDVAAAANYDSGLFVTTQGLLGKFSDGGGTAVVAWLTRKYPDFKPKRILDLGCGLGHNTLPLGQAFPDAEIIAVDVAAPMLRYGHARAQSLGVTNVHFLQADAESLDFEDASFDFIITAQFWHETSAKAFTRVMADIHRMLKPGGLALHLEQPQYQGMDPFEAFMRDWDAYYNNEPFWTTMHDIDLVRATEDAGFAPGSYFETAVEAQLDPDLFPAEPATDGAEEDYGRKPAWTCFGAWKKVQASSQTVEAAE